MISTIGFPVRPIELLEVLATGVPVSGHGFLLMAAAPGLLKVPVSIVKEMAGLLVGSLLSVGKLGSTHIIRVFWHGCGVKSVLEGHCGVAASFWITGSFRIWL